MIRVDAVWLAVAPIDMRAGTDTALARVGDQAFPANRLLASATLIGCVTYCLVLDGQSYRAPKLSPTSTRSKVANGAKAAHS